MDEDEAGDIVELDADRWVLVEIERQWPKYIATWSIRRRVGDSDYPQESGTIERMPPRNPADLDDMLASLRQEAIERAAAETAHSEPETQKKRGFLERLLGRG